MIFSMPVKVQGGFFVYSLHYFTFMKSEEFIFFFNQVSLCLTIPAQDNHFILSCISIYLVFAAGSKFTSAQKENEN